MAAGHGTDAADRSGSRPTLDGLVRPLMSTLASAPLSASAFLLWSPTPPGASAGSPSLPFVEGLPPLKRVLERRQGEMSATAAIVEVAPTA